MLHDATPASRQAAHASQFSGMAVITCSTTSAGDFTSLQCGSNWSSMQRWRAGSLVNRQQTPAWIRSMYSAVDNVRPMRVQVTPAYEEDADNNTVSPTTSSLVPVASQIDSSVISIWQ